MITWQKKGLWLVSLLFLIDQYFMRACMNTVAGHIIRDFNMSAQDFGFVAGSYYVGYMVVVLFGLVVDTLGPVLVLLVGVFLHSLSAYLFTVREGYELFGLAYLFVCRMMTGVGSASALVVLSKLTRTQIEPEKFSIYYSRGFTLSVCGGLVGLHGVTMFLEHHMWQEVFRFVAYMDMLFLVLAFLLRKQYLGQSKPLRLSDLLLVQHLKKFLDPRVISLSLGCAFMTQAIYVFGDAWGCTFLIQGCGCSERAASMISTSFWLGFLIGGCIEYVISQKYGLIKAIIKKGIFMLFFTIPIIVCPELLSENAKMVLFFMMGVCSAVQITGLRAVNLLFSKDEAGINTSIFCAVTMFCGFCSISAVGYLLEIQGVLAGAQQYHLIAYKWALSLVLAATLIGVTIIIRVKKSFDESAGH